MPETDAIDPDVDGKPLEKYPGEESDLLPEKSRVTIVEAISSEPPARVRRGHMETGIP